VARTMLRTAALGLPSVRTETVRRKQGDGSFIEEEVEKLYFEPNCESPKLEELLTILEEMGDEPALVLTHSQKFASVMVDRLTNSGVDCFEWSGANSQKRRDAALQAVRKGEIRVIVAQIEAVGTGTDGLQDSMSTEIWVSESDDPTSNQQGKGRLDRRGQKRQVTRIYIRSEGTHDEGIDSKNLQAALKMAASLRKKAA
jgi:superfamily II DNA/RNA helicase